MSLVSTILGGIIEGGFQFGSMALQNKENKKVGKEAKELATIARGDDLRKQTREYGLAKEGIDLAKEELGIKKKDANREKLGHLVSSLNSYGNKNKAMTSYILGLYKNAGVK